uniref:DNA repair protein XRCC1 n=1 Tax=Culex pipiens TaxID=7175 RepID=A0A8D8GFR0_CULPI
MPTVSLASIESFSSEDPNFPASNLLAKETRRWKCRDAGEKSAFVVFRLDGGAVCITGIDIGNEHSAFVEVLVGRSGPAVPEFREILLTSSFMSPIESRNSTNSGRVRCFTAKELVEPVAKEWWDLVKVI